MSAALKRELAGIALLLLAVFLAGALLFQPAPFEVACSAVRGGFFGPVGACLKRGLFALIGGPASALVPIAATVHGLRYLGRLTSSTDRSWLIFVLGLALLLPVAISLASGADPDSTAMGGLWGTFVAYYLRRGFGSAGAWIMVALATSALTAWTLRWNPIRAVVGSRRSQRDDADASAGTTLAQRLEPPPQELPGIDDVTSHHESPPAAAADVVPRRRERKAKGEVTGNGFASEPSGAVVAPDAGDDDSTYVLPPTDLLTPPPAINTDVGRRELDAMGQKLMDALRTFRVDGELVGRTSGPVVTQF